METGINSLLEEKSSNIIKNNKKLIKKETFLEWVKNIIKKAKNQINNYYADRGNQQYPSKIIDNFLKISKFIPL